MLKKDAAQIVNKQPSSPQANGVEPPVPGKNILVAAKGGGITFAGKLGMYVLSFAFSICVARFLGATSYGLYKLMVTVVTLLAAVSLLGLDGGLVRFLAIARKEKNERKVWGLIQIGTGFTGLVSLIITAVVLLFAEEIATTFLQKPAFAPILKMGALAIPLAVFAHSLAAIAQGFKKVEYISYTQDIGFNLIKLLLSVGLLMLGFGVMEIAIAYVISTAIALVFMGILIHRLFPLVRSLRNAEWPVKDLLNFSVPLYLQRLLNRFGGDFETLFLAYFGVMADVGIYGAILPISAIGKLALDSVRKIAEPLIAELHSQGKIAELKQLYQTTTKWALTFNLPIYLTILLFAETLLSVFGETFTDGSLALIILATGVMLNVASGTCGTLINMSGYSRLGLVNSIIYLVTTIILDFLLIPKWYLIGTALAAALTILINNLLRLGEVYVLFNRMIPFNRSFIKPLAAAIAAGSLIGILIRFLWIDWPMLQFLVFTPLLWLVYGSLILVFGLSEEDQFILNKVQNKFHFRKK